MDYLGKARRVLEIEIFEIQRLRDRLDDNFTRAVELIKEAVETRGKVVVLGVGKSGHIGAKIAATLTSTGSPAVVLDSLNALHGDLGMVSDGDVVLALSASGETEELIRLLESIRRIGARVISITGSPRSTLAKAAGVYVRWLQWAVLPFYGYIVLRSFMAALQRPRDPDAARSHRRARAARDHRR